MPRATHKHAIQKRCLKHTLDKIITKKYSNNTKRGRKEDKQTEGTN